MQMQLFEVRLADLIFRPRDQHDAAYVQAQAISLLLDGQKEPLEVKAESGRKGVVQAAKDSAGRYTVYDGNGRCEAIQLLVHQGIPLALLTPLLDTGAQLHPRAEVRNVQTQTAAQQRVFFPVDLPIAAKLAVDAAGRPSTREEVLMVKTEVRRGLSIIEAVRTAKKLVDAATAKGADEKAAIAGVAARYGVKPATIKKYLWVYSLPAAVQDGFFNGLQKLSALRGQFDAAGQPKPPKAPKATVPAAVDAVRHEAELLWADFAAGRVPAKLHGLTPEQLDGSVAALRVVLGLTPLAAPLPPIGSEDATGICASTIPAAPATGSVTRKKKRNTAAVLPAAETADDSKLMPYSYPPAAELVRVVESVNPELPSHEAITGLLVQRDQSVPAGTYLVEQYPNADEANHRHDLMRLVMVTNPDEQNGQRMRVAATLSDWQDEGLRKRFLRVVADVLAGKWPVYSWPIEIGQEDLVFETGKVEPEKVEETFDQWLDGLQEAEAEAPADETAAPTIGAERAKMGRWKRPVRATVVHSDDLFTPESYQIDWEDVDADEPLSPGDLVVCFAEGAEMGDQWGVDPDEPRGLEKHIGIPDGVDAKYIFDREIWQAITPAEEQEDDEARIQERRQREMDYHAQHDPAPYELLNAPEEFIESDELTAEDKRIAHPDSRYARQRKRMAAGLPPVEPPISLGDLFGD